jgi:hypothetical protein
MKVGDRVRVLTVPTGLPEREILGKYPYMDSIWIEPEHVEVIADTDRRNLTERR